MSRFDVIDLDTLGEMDVIEALDSDAGIDLRMSKLVAYWTKYDPPAAAQYDVDELEFDPLKIQAENNTYFDTLLRDRINQAARAVTLAFSTGSDLDAIATRYPVGPRLALVSNPRDYDEAPIDWESDDRYRRRTQLSLNALSPHGPAGSYMYWALTADALLKDVAETGVEGDGEVVVTCMDDLVRTSTETDAAYNARMLTDWNPRPSLARLLVVRAYIFDQFRKGASDIITIEAPKVIDTNYTIDMWLYPGPNQTLVVAQAEKALADLVEKQRWLGQDHSLMMINKACALDGVHHIVIKEPATDLLADTREVVRVKKISVAYKGRAE